MAQQSRVLARTCTELTTALAPPAPPLPPRGGPNALLNAECRHAVHVVTCAHFAAQLLTLPAATSCQSQSTQAPPLPPQVAKGYSSAREALLLNGRFIMEQLKALDAAAGKSTTLYASGDFGTALQAEVGHVAGLLAAGRSPCCTLYACP